MKPPSKKIIHATFNALSFINNLFFSSKKKTEKKYCDENSLTNCSNEESVTISLTNNKQYNIINFYF